MNSDGHCLLERSTSCQDLNVNNEDVTRTTCTTRILFLGLDTWSCDGRANTHGIGGVASGVGLLYLLSDTLLASLIKVREICRCQTLLFGILQGLLLVVLAHSLNSLRGILCHSWVRPVWEFHNVVAINVLRPRVWPATAKAVDCPTSSLTYSS